MTAGTLAIAVLQHAGLSIPVLLLMLGVANLIVALAVARTMPDTRLSQQGLSFLQDTKG
jgi:hypothetical protein